MRVYALRSTLGNTSLKLPQGTRIINKTVSPGRQALQRLEVAQSVLKRKIVVRMVRRVRIRKIRMIITDKIIWIKGVSLLTSP